MSKKREGGVAICIASELQYKSVNCYTDVHEILHIEIRIKKDMDLSNNGINLLAAVYYPHDINSKH